MPDKEDSKRSFCFTEIQTFEDLECALVKAKLNNYNLKYYVKNETVFKWILNNPNGAHSQRLGGSGVNFARQLAYLKNTDVTLVSKIEKSSLKLIPNNVKVVSVLDESKKVGLRNYGAIVYYSDKRKAVFDRVGLKSVSEDFKMINVQLIQEIGPHCLVIGRFPLFREEFIDRISNQITELAHSLSSIPAGIIIHHQLGLMDNVKAGKLLVKQFIPYIDSLDLGLMELHQFHSLIRGGTFDPSMYTSDIETSLTILQDVWTILNSGSFSARTGTRSVSRIHLRAHDYHILLVKLDSPLFYMNLRHALAKGLMAQIHSRCHRKMAILKEIVHFHMEDEFFLTRNLTSSPIQCWTEDRKFKICVSPVPTCFELKYPLESGESTAAAALASQIKIPI